MTLSERIIEAMARGISRAEVGDEGCWEVCMPAARAAFIICFNMLLKIGPSAPMIKAWYDASSASAKADLDPMLRALLSELEGKEGA